MKLEYTIENIKEAQDTLEKVYEKATQLTQKYFEIVHGEKPKSAPYVESIEFKDIKFKNDYFTAYNSLDHQYDYKGMDDLTSLLFPTEWLYVENEDELNEKMTYLKKEIEERKEEMKRKGQEMLREKQEADEKKELKRLQKKYPK